MSTPPDPFAAFESERTVIKPKPRTPGGTPPAPAPAPFFGGADPTPAADVGELGLLNPLVSAAGKLLVLIGKLRNLAQPPNVPALRASTADAVNQFDASARRAGVGNESVLAARYVLCTALDEAVANTPWGVQAGWNKQSLLVQFHNETWGGEKVFQLLAKLAQDVPTHRQLLELIYSVLALGFEGRYRVIDNGRAQIEAVRDRLAQIIRQQRGDHAPALAEHWQGQPARQRRAYSWLPLAATAAVAALVLSCVYLGLTLSLGERSDPVFGQIQALRLPPPVAVTPPPPAKPRLAQFLQSDIKANLVTVRDEVDRSVVTIRGDGLFASGSATLQPEREALMIRIADALAKVAGPILVTGHTDKTPVRTVRFPSNWHLSEERAQSVRQLLLAHSVAAERVLAEGRADSEPVAPDNDPVQRAQNRRVEITLFVGRGGEPVPSATAAASEVAR